jgi:putative flippase GtrA
LPRRSTYSAPLRYAVVVLFGFTTDFGVYASLVWGGASIYVANVAGFCLGAVVNVLLIRRYVFPSSRFRVLHDIALTLASNGLMLLLGLMILWTLVEILGVGVYWAKVVTNGLTFALNYTTRVAFFRGR